MKSRFFLVAVLIITNKIVVLSQGIIYPRLVGISLQGGRNSCFANYGVGLHIRPFKLMEFSAIFNNAVIQGFGYTACTFIYPTKYKFAVKRSLRVNFPMYIQPSVGLFYTSFGTNYIGLEADSTGLRTQLAVPHNTYMGCTIGA